MVLDNFRRGQRGGVKVANIKSAQKRIRVSARRQAENKHVKSLTKTAIKKAKLAAESGNKSKADEMFKEAVSAIDKAASKGVYHKNTASRKKSQLAKLVNKVAV